MIDYDNFFDDMDMIYGSLILYYDRYIYSFNLKWNALKIADDTGKCQILT